LRGRDPRAVVAAEASLWDLAGQAARLSVHRLFGGPTRERIPLYANINRAMDEHTPVGFGAVKLAPFDGLDRRRLREPDGHARMARGLACVAAVRATVGAATDVYVDCHSRFDVATAVEVAGERRALDVTWREEPVRTDDLPALTCLRPLLEARGLELLGGEHLVGIGMVWPFLAAGVWDTIMPDVKHGGGIAEAVAIGRLAASRGVTVAPHNPSGPVAMPATAPVVAALPEVRAREYAWGEVPWRAGLVGPPARIVDGALVVPTGPGIGAVLDAATVAVRRADDAHAGGGGA